MDMTLVYIVLALLVGIFLAKIVPMFSDKKISDEEKQIMQDITMQIIKDAIVLFGVKDKASLVNFCTDRVLAELEKNKIKAFTKDEITVVVTVALDTIEKAKNKEINLQKL